MVDPQGKGIYFISGVLTGSLTAYDAKTRSSTEIVSDVASQPAISPDGKQIMYVVYVSRGVKEEVWVANIDGTNAVKIATGKGAGTASWSPDGKQITYMVVNDAGVSRGYSASADGHAIQELAQVPGQVQAITWSLDEKEIYETALNQSTATVWRFDSNGANPRKFIDGIYVLEPYPDGKHMLGVVISGSKMGIYAVAVAEQKLIPVLPDVGTFVIHSSADGRSIIYPVPGRDEIPFYRQGFVDGKVIGQPEIISKLPFTFPLDILGNAYDFSRDLSKIVFARLSGKSDVYLLKESK
jgi:dipeptidyl aminopeptidase/acylaminoacyl peptidase